MSDAPSKPFPTGLHNTPGSIKSLRAYWKNGLADPPADDLRNELTGASDRATVVLIGSQLDDALRYRLSLSMAYGLDDKDFDHVFRNEGPLGSFSSRIEIAYLFGVIDERTRSQLTAIREMRNACAHSCNPITFDVPQLGEVAKRVLHPTGFVSVPKSGVSSIRSAFILEFVIIFHTLISGRAKAIEIFQSEVREFTKSNPISPSSAGSELQ
jgi:hypothetical protein